MHACGGCRPSQSEDGAGGDTGKKRKKGFTRGPRVPDADDDAADKSNPLGRFVERWSGLEIEQVGCAAASGGGGGGGGH